MTIISPSPEDRPVLSIVTTLYKSAGTIKDFCARAIVAAEFITDSFELVIVDDGSPDDALAIAQEAAKRDRRILVVELSRNFGHHKALMTGMMHARGEHCLLIDSDLEEDPALLSLLWEKMQQSGADVVYGFQRERAGNGFRRWSGALAYQLMDLLISPKIPRNHITLRLMKRCYVESLILHKEQRTVIGGLWVITGYRQVGIPVDKLVRGETTYTAMRRIWSMIDSITSFSELPLVGIFYLGLIISALSTCYAIFLMVRWALGGASAAGWLSVMVSVWILGGLMIFCIGLIGIYISKIFIETKGRPYTIVRSLHRYDSTNAGVHDQ
jgi:putative glycosyltransferase